MAKAPVVEKPDFIRAVKVAAVTGQSKLRDVALLWTAYGTGMMPIELARLQVDDYLKPDGSVRRDSEIRAEIAFNGKRRPLYWTNKSVLPAIDAYLAERGRYGYGAGDSERFRGLNPKSHVTITRVSYLGIHKE